MILPAAIMLITAVGGAPAMSGQAMPAPSLRLVDGSRLDSVVVELSVDMNGLATCDVFQVTVEAPYGSEYLSLGEANECFLADDEGMSAGGVNPHDVKLSAVTPYRKNPRRMIILVDHTMQARTSGKARFPDGRFVIGRFALSFALLGDYDKYKVRLVEGAEATTFPTGQGRQTLTPLGCQPLVLSLSGGVLR